MKFAISCILDLQMLHTKLDTIGPVVLEKNVLTHDERRQMPTIAISHMSESGDLKGLFIEGK